MALVNLVISFVHFILAYVRSNRRVTQTSLSEYTVRVLGAIESLNTQSDISNIQPKVMLGYYYRSVMLND